MPNELCQSVGHSWILLGRGWQRRKPVSLIDAQCSRNVPRHAAEAACKYFKRNDIACMAIKN